MAYRMKGFSGFGNSPLKQEVKEDVKAVTKHHAKKVAKPIVKKSLAKIGAKTLARFVGPVGIALTMADVGNFITRAGKSVMPGLKERAKREAEGGNMYTSSKL